MIFNQPGSQVGWANVFLFAHHFFNEEGGQEKDFAHPTFSDLKIFFV